ncbi:MAG TPA: DUF4956 domain-containing protein [Longilinea sp.]|nr:DUF4956 domain-containing protein [Longilinea sp.]
MSTYLEFILGFLFNLLFALVVVRFIYYPMTHNKPYVFTFLAFNTVIYFVLSFIYSLEISVGVGFGLFAIFSILRYRTDPIPIREMTYLFVIAALPVMNSAGVKAGIWIELLIANLAIALILFVLEKEWGFHFEASKRITYERIDLIKPENYQLLINDLQERTGLTIKSAVVGKINFLRDTAEVKIIYENGHENAWLHTMEREVVYTTTSSDDD